MKFILMMNGSKADFERYTRCSKEDLQSKAAFMRAFSEELRDSGLFVASEELGWPDDARLVRAGSKGEPITDGVFPQSKQFLAGYWIIDVEGSEQAFAIAARLSEGPGVGGQAGTMPVEVRQLLSGHSDFEL
jgi:hypothetical protein